MTNQIQGEILFKGIDPASQWVFTPWMPVHGDIATFGIEILLITGGITITWNVETRTLEDPDPATFVDLYTTNQTATGAGPDIPSALPNKPAKELVRYKIATGATADATEWAILRALQPSWQTDGR